MYLTCRNYPLFNIFTTLQRTKQRMREVTKYDNAIEEEAAGKRVSRLKGGERGEGEGHLCFLRTWSTVKKYN